MPDRYDPQEAHNKGQTDYRDGKYDPPSGPSIAELFGESLGIDPNVSKDWDRARENYDQGYDNAKEQDSSSSGCFLSTACVRARELPDDCRELQVLRRFRDEYLLKCPAGQRLVAEYYVLAPKVTAAIDARADAAAVYRELYDSLVAPAVERIEAGDLPGACELYRQVTMRAFQKLA